MKTGKSWREKLADSKGLPKVGRITGRMTRRWGTGTMVIPAPKEVDALMKKVPAGKLLTINELRARLAQQHKASIACPITTGIFAWIAAHAAEEAAAAGKNNVTPYWRTLKSGGQLNEKYPGGIPRLKKRLEAEGHRVFKRGKRYFVADFEKSLAFVRGERRSAMGEDKLILFVKAPRPGAVKTRLAKVIGVPAAGAAYRQLVEKLLDQLQRLSGVEVCFSPDDAADEVQHWLREGWTSNPQGDGDLGERLQSAFQRAFHAGAKRVAIIGSDCPAVRVEDIREAWRGLRTHDVVLGPATDGGYWLIGLRQLRPDLFRGIHWSSESVFAETIQRARRAGLTVQLLRELADVDTDRDWRAFLAAQNRDGMGA